MLSYLKFRLKQKLAGQEDQYTTSSFFSVFKDPGLKNKKKKIIKINHLIIVLVKMILLIFLLFYQYGLACKYGIIFQILISNWIQSCIF